MRFLVVDNSDQFKMLMLEKEVLELKLKIANKKVSILEKKMERISIDLNDINLYKNRFKKELNFKKG